MQDVLRGGRDPPSLCKMKSSCVGGLVDPPPTMQEQDPKDHAALIIFSVPAPLAPKYTICYAFRRLRRRNTQFLEHSGAFGAEINYLFGILAPSAPKCNICSQFRRLRHQNSVFVLPSGAEGAEMNYFSFILGPCHDQDRDKAIM